MSAGDIDVKNDVDCNNDVTINTGVTIGADLRARILARAGRVDSALASEVSAEFALSRGAAIGTGEHHLDVDAPRRRSREDWRAFTTPLWRVLGWPRRLPPHALPPTGGDIAREMVRGRR